MNQGRFQLSVIALDKALRQPAESAPRGLLQGKEVARRDRRIEIELLEEAPALKVGSLIEIATEDSILLGELRSMSGKRLEIAVEHTVDREKVAAIQALWEPG